MPVSESSAMHQLRCRSAQKPQLDCLSRILIANRPWPLGPLLLRDLKQTRRSEIGGWSSFIGSARPDLESWEVRLANHTVDRVKDLAAKGENPMAGAESKAGIGDSQWPRNRYPGTTEPTFTRRGISDSRFRVSRIQMTS